MLFIKLVVLLLISMNQNNAARILGFFSVPSISHQVVFRQLTYELAKVGHTLVVITPDPAFHQDEVGKNITEIDVHDLSYDLWQEHFVANINGKSTPFDIFKMIFELLPDIAESQLLHEQVQEMIKRNDKFDLLIMETHARAGLILSHIFQTPVIQVSSLGSIYPNLNVIGALSHPVLYPEMFSERVHNMNVLEKISSIWHDIKIRRYMQHLEDKNNKVMERILGRNAPTVKELEKNVEMIFLNVYPLWDGNRLVPPGLVYIGGIYQRPKQEMSEDIKKYMDSSKHGVLYMSLGTNVNTSLLPSTAVQVFMNVFSKMPYDILLKWNTEEVIGKPKNVKLFKWLPQPELLKHPNTKLFINQGGLQSTEEAIFAAVPMVAFPMLADQWYNAEKYLHFGIGLKLDISTVTEEQFENAIETIINNSRDNILRLRSILVDEPQSPAERAVWGVGRVLRLGPTRALRTPLADVSWAEYLVLDAVVVLFGVLLMSLAVFLYGIKLSISLIKTIFYKFKKIKAN